MDNVIDSSHLLFFCEAKLAGSVALNHGGYLVKVSSQSSELEEFVSLQFTKKFGAVEVVEAVD